MNELAFFILLLLFNAMALVFRFFPPKKINPWYGYRTLKAMSSEENWKKANGIFANVLTKKFLALTAVLLPLFFIFGAREHLIILELAGFVGLIVSSIIYTEIKT
jgi:uncharacterized membrane protein